MQQIITRKQKEFYTCLALFAAILVTGCGSKVQTGSSTAPTDSSNTTGETTTVEIPNGEIIHKDSSTGVVTRKSCQVASDCKVDGTICQNHKCFEKDDPCAKITCGPLERCERGAGGLANVGFCVANCALDKQCGGKCSDSSTKECVDFKWTEPCDGGIKHCLTSAGPVCCAAGTECIGNACLDTGSSCNINEEEYCKSTEYCEESIGKCINYEANTSLCLFRPPNLEKTYTKLHHKNEVVYVTPLVIDLDRDKIPEIVYLNFSVNGANYDSELVAIKSQPRDPNQIESVEVMWRGRGDSGAFIYSDIAPAAAELDGNPENGPEIVVLVNANSKPQTAIRAFHADGSKYFETLLPSDTFHATAGGISIGDINRDGFPEIVTLGHVYSHNGKHLFTLPLDRNSLPNVSKWSGSYDLVNDVPVLADVNKDGFLDIIEGQMVFLYKPNPDGSMNFEQPTLDDTTTEKATRPYPSGATTAVANFDAENKSSYPQIVNVYESKIVLADWRGKVIAKTYAPTLNGSQWDMGGTPTIGDFDNDGKPEIGVAFSGGLVVYDVEPNASGKLTLEVAWYFKATDITSEVTGTSVFDFDGDGIAEVVFVDNKKIYVLNGTTGARSSIDPRHLTTPLFEHQNANSSIWGTSLEPVVADVDNDGHADIITASNNGIRVYSHPQNYWVPTRTIWNQHAYNVTNINTDGTVPREEKKNWELPWLNNFRQNVQAGNPFLAPDFIVKVDPPFKNSCVLETTLPLNFQVQNIGSATAHPDSVAVEIYTIQNGVEKLISKLKNKNSLPPSAYELFSEQLSLSDLGGRPFDLKFVVDTEENYNECREDNNTVVLKDISPAAADASVVINSIQSQECLTSGTVNIRYTIYNNGKTDIPVDTLPISLYYQIGTGQRVKIVDILNTKPIPANGSAEMTYTWSSYPGEVYKLVKVEVVIDEPNHLVECSEANNSANSTFVCQIAG